MSTYSRDPQYKIALDQLLNSNKDETPEKKFKPVVEKRKR